MKIVRITSLLVLTALSIREFRNSSACIAAKYGTSRHVCSGGLGEGVEVVVAASGEPPSAINDCVDAFSNLGCEAIVRVMDAPNVDKPTLLNEAMRMAASPSVLIYDIDSRPTQFPHPRSCVIAQQLSVYAIAEKDRSFWQGVADNQSFWALGYERRSLVDGCRFYLVGHGLLLRRGIRDLAEFRIGKPGEDLYLGYQASVGGLKPCILEGFDVCTAPVGFRRMFFQSERWLVGELTALLDIRASRDGSSLPLVLFRSLGIVFWIVGPWITLAALAGSGMFVAASVIAVMVRYAEWRILLRALDGAIAPISGTSSAGRFVGFLAKPIVGSVASVWALGRLFVNGGGMGHIVREERIGVEI